MDFYRIRDDMNYPNRWFLGEINSDMPLNTWKFTSSKKVIQYLPLYLDISSKGIALDFTFAAFDVPIVNRKIMPLLPANEVQLIPVRISNFKKFDEYFILNILNVVDCVDENRSKFIKWEVNNDVRPDLAGSYKYIEYLIINSNKIKVDNIFRLKKYEIACIISGELKRKFEEYKISGLKYERVTL